MLMMIIILRHSSAWISHY